MSTIFSLFLKDKVLYMIIIICLINITPSYEALITSYMIDYLKMSLIDMADLSTYNTIFYLFALYLY